jgi:hypothetical protein
VANLEYTIDTSGKGFGSRFLRPTGNVGLVDVVNDFAWTLSPKDARRDVSRVFLKEFQQNGGQLIASILYYARLAGRTLNNGVGEALWSPSDPAEVYKFKYIADPTGWEYSFPFFSQSHTTRGNTFGNGDQKNPFAQLADLGKTIIGFGNTASAKGSFLRPLATFAGKTSEVLSIGEGVINSLLPGKISFETPQSWSGTTEESITISFHLFNTRSVEDVRNNRNLAHILRYNNTPNRKNFAIVDPPVIYSLFIPDVIHLPACYMSNLQIMNLGNTRLMDIGDGKTKTIPEAYSFSMTFNSLLMPTRNILQALDKGEIVEAISNIEGLQRAVDLVQKIGSDALNGNSDPFDRQELLNTTAQLTQ